MNSKPLFVFAGGGTGGHLFPALAIVEWFREHHQEVEFEFLCTQKPIDRQILQKWGVPFTVQPVRPLHRQLLTLPGFFLAWHRSTKLCRARFHQRHPVAVVGTGGYGSGPAMKSAIRLGIPTALLNPDAIPGKANRHFARVVNEIYLQWPDTSKHFPPTARIHVTGCPVRKDFVLPATGAEYQLFGLDPELKTLLITGASSGARNINDAIIQLTPQLAQVSGWQILHIGGEEDVSRLKAAYNESRIAARVLAFTDRMAAALRCSDLAVARAGAVTLAELSSTATPAILLPYPYHRDQHQQANAENLARCGAAIIVKDCKEARGNAAMLTQTLLPLMQDPAKLAAMSARTRTSAVVNSAEVVSQRLLTLAGLSAS